MTRDASFKRRVRARMERTGEAYSTARARLDRKGGGGDRVLHLTNGDSVSQTLCQAGVEGRIVEWVDVLYDGPVPAVPAAELRGVRAAHLASRDWGDAGAIERRFADRDRAVETHGGEYVLWFEADLFDQLLLAQLLDALRRLGVDPARATLVSIGEYRGIAHFGGLGQLDAAQLAGLAGEGVPLTAETLELASTAWAAFTAPGPEGLAAIVRARSAELRFLGEAFGRLLQEFPSRTDGLSLTQRRILLAAAEGSATAIHLFLRVGRTERRPFLGDTQLFTMVEELAACAVPLVSIGTPERPIGQREVALTDAGREVLAGREDHIRRSGIDRWIGGTHLVGTAVRWRYDERLETLVTADGG